MKFSNIISCSTLLATVATAFSPVNVHSIEPLINSTESLQIREIIDKTRLLCAVDQFGNKRACLDEFRNKDIDVLASNLNNLLLGKQLVARSEASSSFSGSSSSGEEVDCSFEPRNLKKPIRIGALFAVLATSALGVFPPVLATSVFKIDLQSLPMTFVKQFGTGVVLSTAYVHLAAESQEDFTNECIGELDYDPTAMSFVLAGTFIAFVLEYGSARWLRARKDRKKHNHSDDSENDDSSKENSDNKNGTVDVIERQIDMSGAANMGCAAHNAALIDPTDKISVIIMEGGIIFHSALVGVAVTIAADDGFIALFIAILFHQTFEGIGLGSRIAGLTKSSLFFKLSMCTYFTIITPIGMAIGLGVMDSMNSNDPATIWAIGTISALSAGVLIWAGIVEMLAFDWLFGDLSFAPKKRVFFAMTGLVAGMICMSLIGKWA